MQGETRKPSGVTAYGDDYERDEHDRRQIRFGADVDPFRCLPWRGDDLHVGPCLFGNAA